MVRDEYDFSKGVRGKYANRFKKQVTIRLEEGSVQYFKDMAEEIGVPYQTIINLYLRECAATGRKLNLDWLRPDETIKGIDS